MNLKQLLLYSANTSITGVCSTCQNCVFELRPKNLLFNLRIVSTKSTPKKILYGLFSKASYLSTCQILRFISYFFLFFFFLCVFIIICTLLFELAEKNTGSNKFTPLSHGGYVHVRMLTIRIKFYCAWVKPRSWWIR